MISKKALLVGLSLVALLALVGATVARRPVQGPLLRTITLGTDPGNVAVDGATGHAFVVDRNTNGYAALGQGTVSLVDTRAGKLLRTVPVGPDPREAAIDTRNGRVLVANDDDGSVSVLDAGSGRLLGEIHVGSHPHNVAVDARSDRAFVVNSGDGSMSVLDTRRAVVLRTVRLSEDFALSGVAVDARTGRVFGGDTPAAAHPVRVLDVHGNNAAGAPVHPAAGAYGAVSYPSVLYGMNSLVFDPTPAPGAPAGRIFMTGGASLSLLDARTGAVLRTVVVGGNLSAVAVDPRRHRVYVTSIKGVDANGAPAGPGRLTALDERSGAILRSVDAGMTPRAVAVDAGSGHVVVVDEGGSVTVPDAWGWVPVAIRQRLPFLNSPVRTRAVPASIAVLDLNH